MCGPLKCYFEFSNQKETTKRKKMEAKKPHLGIGPFHMFRQEYKKAHPELLRMNVSEQLRQITQHWKELSCADKQPYITLSKGFPETLRLDH
jgi:hypothetical protein